MQQPQQQQQFVPYFNQPRVQAPQAPVQQPVVYAEQQPQQPQQPQIPQQQLIYPQIHQQQMPLQQPAAPAWQCGNGYQGGCRWSQCCKRFNLPKGFKIAVITPAVTYVACFILSMFSRYSPVFLYILPIIMSIIIATVGIVGLKKKSVTFLGVFLGMAIFSLLAGFYSFTPSLVLAFYSFSGFLVAATETVTIVVKIVSIVLGVKLIKKIQNDESLELPSYTEPQAEQVQVVPQQAPIVLPQQITVPQVPVVPQQPVISQVPQVIPQQQQQVPQKNFDHDLNLLREMGFVNVELNTRLLQKHNGNLAAVLQELVSH